MIQSAPTHTDTIDLSTCAQEPIHIPGSIQPHGLLFVLDEPALTVLQASANAADLFPDGVLGKPLEALFDAEWSSVFRGVIQSVSLERNPLYLRTVTLSTEAGQRSFHAIVHRSQGTLILELESTVSAQSLSFHDLYSLVRAFMADLQNLSNPRNSAHWQPARFAGLPGLMVCWSISSIRSGTVTS